MAVATIQKPETVNTPSIEDAVKKRVFDDMGGVPQGFMRMTVNRIYGDTFRCNVYVEDPTKIADLCFVKTPMILKSLIMVAK